MEVSQCLFCSVHLTISLDVSFSFTVSVLPELILLVDASVTGIQTRDSNEPDMIVFSVQVKGAIPAVTLDEVSWMYTPDGAGMSVNITESSDIKLNVSNDVASLTITRVKLSHSGIYTAVVNHPAGRVLAPSIKLDVQGKAERVCLMSTAYCITHWTSFIPVRGTIALTDVLLQ